MKRINTSPISGMQEFLPAAQAIFDNIKSKITETYRRHGFQHIETPTIDRNEVLFAKAGGDTEKQIYRVIKTDERAEDSSQALRFDHTVPLARYIVEHESELSFPFRVTQIGRNFRGERAQKGRFREFYQCDVDIVGRGELPLIYDAEVIFTFYQALASFLKTPVKIRLNNRKFLSAVLDALGVADAAAEIYSIIDHSEKVPAEKTHAALESLNLSSDNVVKITTLINTHGDITAIERLGYENAGLAELKQVFSELRTLGLPESAIEIDLKIVRGLDYYTGTVFEAVLPDYPELGSIGGGGRYDNLASHYTDQKFPGVGASIGLSRLFYVLQENRLLSGDNAAISGSSIPVVVDYALVPLGAGSAEQTAAVRAKAHELAAKLRARGCSVDVILADKKLGDLLKHASKIAHFGVVLGEDELRSGRLLQKDFATGEQTELDSDA